LFNYKMSRVNLDISKEINAMIIKRLIWIFKYKKIKAIKTKRSFILDLWSKIQWKR
jgi:hypothetical protein